MVAAPSAPVLVAPRRPRPLRRAGAASLALIAALLSTGPGEAAAQGEGRVAVLEYAFERLAGRTAVLTLETEQRVAQEVRGQGGGEVLSWTRQTLEQRFERGERGGGRVIVTPTRIEARLEQGGRVTRWDSATGPAPQLFVGLGARIGRAVTILVARTGEVTGVEGVTPAEAKSYGEASLFLELPGRPVRVSEGWDRVDRKPMEPLCALVFHFRYVLASIEPPAPATETAPARPERRRIEATITARLEDVLPGTTTVELAGQDGRGWLVLDPDGLTLESVLESRLELVIKTPAATQVQRIRNTSTLVLVEVHATPADPPR